MGTTDAAQCHNTAPVQIASLSVRYHLNGRTVLITGGAKGLGKQLALRAAAKGASVVIWDICAESAQSTAEHIIQGGGDATAMHVDVADRSAVRRAAWACGEVDVLIN